MKLADPRRVFLWISFATSITVSVKVSYHSRTVPVKAGPGVRVEVRAISAPVLLLTNLPGERLQKKLAPLAPVSYTHLTLPTIYSV